MENRLVFKTITDYENIVNQPTEQTKTKFLKTVNLLNGFTSFAKKQNTSTTLRTSTGELENLIKDDYFKSILNSDLAVQIGNNIFRVNPVTEKVYALPVANADQYKDLISENTTNRNIQTFSTADNILDIIQNDGYKALICKQSGIGSYHPFTGVINVDNAGTIQISGKLNFDRYGLYFTLYSEANANANGLVEVTTEFSPVYYHVRCGATVGPYYLTSGYGSLSKYKVYQSYQGSKNLNEVYFRARFHGKIILPNGTPFTKDSGWIQIRVNY